MRNTIVSWLEETEVPYLAPSALRSDFYGDASHPLAEGYEGLAKEALKESVLSARGKRRG